MQALVHRHPSLKRSRSADDILDDLAHMGSRLDALPETLKDNLMTVIESFAVEERIGFADVGLYARSDDDDCVAAAHKRLCV